jgi:hypothetical protein
MVAVDFVCMVAVAFVCTVVVGFVSTVAVGFVSTGAASAYIGNTTIPTHMNNMNNRLLPITFFILYSIRIVLEAQRSLFTNHH